MLYGLYQTNESLDWTFVLDVLFRPTNLINISSDVIISERGLPSADTWRSSDP